MTTIYRIEEVFPADFNYSLRVNPYFDMNYWCNTLVTQEQFENSQHKLIAQDENYEKGLSEHCADICKADTAVWTIPEKAWGFLNQLETSACRIDITYK